MKKKILSFGLVFVMCFCFSFINEIEIYAENTMMKTGPVFNLSVAYSITAIISFLLLISYLSFIKKRDILFVMMYSAVFLVNVGYFFLSSSTNVAEALLANKISYLGAVFLPLFMLLIIAKECNVNYHRFILAGLLVVSCSVFLLTATPGYNGLYYESVALSFECGSAVLVKTYGPYHKVYYIYLALYFFAMALTILYTYYKNKEKPLRVVIHLLLAVSCNIMVWYMGQLFHFDFEFLSVSYIVTELYMFAIYHVLDTDIQKKESEAEHVSVAVEIHQNDLDDYISHHSFPDIQQIMELWPQVETLTTREIEVFQLMLENKRRKDIAEELCISENTVKKHTSNIFGKLNISHRSEIVQMINEKSHQKKEGLTEK